MQNNGKESRIGDSFFIIRKSIFSDKKANM